MHDLDEIGLRRHYSIDVLVRHRRLVDDTNVLAALDAGCRLLMVFDRETALRLGARHGTSRTVAAGMERVRIALAAHDVGTRPHRARDDAQIALARAHRPL